MSCSGVLWLKILTYPQGFQLTLSQIASLRAFVTLWTCPQQLNSSLILSLSLDFFFFEVVSQSLSHFHFQDGNLLSSQLAVPVWLHTEVNQSGKCSSQPSCCSHSTTSSVYQKHSNPSLLCLYLNLVQQFIKILKAQISLSVGKENRTCITAVFEL